MIITIKLINIQYLTELPFFLLISHSLPFRQPTVCTLYVSVLWNSVYLLKIIFSIFLQPQAGSWGRIYLPYNNPSCYFNFLNLFPPLCLYKD